MSFNEFLRDHYKAAVGAVRSAHVAVPCAFVKHSTAPRHDDRLSSSRAPLLPRVHARPYYIPGAFSQIESYGLELTNGADTCHDANAR